MSTCAEPRANGFSRIELQQTERMERPATLLKKVFDRLLSISFSAGFPDWPKSIAD
jgi:hypothetical protein